MLIIQFQFENTTDEEQELIPEFCLWLCDQMCEKLNTGINNRKIQLRMKYLSNISWIQWKNKDYISSKEIMNSIGNSITYEQYRKNIWKIVTDPNILIPNSYTSIDRLIRFLNYGDSKTTATGIFTNLQSSFGFHKLNNLWKVFVTGKLGTMLTEAKILTK